MRYFLLLFASLYMSTGFAQSSALNEYEYVLVPLKFEFQKKENQYRLNTLTKFLLEKEGFKVFFEGEQPAHIANSPCKALTAELLDESGIFTTRVKLVLNDCYGKPVVTTSEGNSKIKEFEPSYHEAVKEAFDDISAMEYAYEPTRKKEDTETESAASPVVKAEITEAAVVAPDTKVVPAGETDTISKDGSTLKEQNGESPQVLYAQPVPNGYQLVDTTPAIRFRVRKTGKPNTFAITGKDGLLYQLEDGSWVAEYYENEAMVREVFQIKF